MEGSPKLDRSSLLGSTHLQSSSRTRSSDAESCTKRHSKCVALGYGLAMLLGAAATVITLIQLEGHGSTVTYPDKAAFISALSIAQSGQSLRLAGTAAAPVVIRGIPDDDCTTELSCLVVPRGVEVILEHVEVTQHTSAKGDGGLLSVSGVVRATDCKFKNGLAESGAGGAIAVKGGSLQCTRCDFTGNEARSLGGAIYVQHISWFDRGSLLLRNSTYQGNQITDQANPSTECYCTNDVVDCNGCRCHAVRNPGEGDDGATWCP